MLDCGSTTLLSSCLIAVVPCCYHHAWLRKLIKSGAGTVTWLLLWCILHRNMKTTIQHIADDARCDVHQTILGIRDGKEGWFHLYCPGGIACDDEGHLYGIMVGHPQTNAGSCQMPRFLQLCFFCLWTLFCELHFAPFFPLGLLVEAADGVLLPTEEVPARDAEDDQSLHAAGPEGKWGSYGCTRVHL